jgi:hypothetical protein
VQLTAELVDAANVSVSITDVTGQLVQRFNDLRFSNGSQTITLPVAALAPGVYFVTLRNGTESVTRKLIRN